MHKYIYLYRSEPSTSTIADGAGHIADLEGQSRQPHSYSVQEDEDDDAHDKVAFIQKLVSLEGGATAVTAAGGLNLNRLAETATTLGYFALWFALNVYYNIVNKHVSTDRYALMQDDIIHLCIIFCQF